MTPLDRLAARRDQHLPRLIQQLGQNDGLVQQRVDAVAGRLVDVDGQRLINFASSDYLGLAVHPAVRHAVSLAAEQWGTSLSQPRFWAIDQLTWQLERRLAQLVGQEQALVFSSTAQIASDVLPVLAGIRGAILMDECAYPISQRAAEAVIHKGVKVHRFPHNDPDHLAQIMKRLPTQRDKVIVCDGLYMTAGETAPLPAFDDVAKRYGATIYVDDAQGVGLLGHGPSARHPFGHGGGGTPAYCGVEPGRIVHVSTLAKALGVPLAFVAGPRRFIDYLRTTAFSHLHCSPPALPVVAAALAAVRLNATDGDRRRRYVCRLVECYQAVFPPDGLSPLPALPMQSIYFGTRHETLAVAAFLRRRGIWPVVQLQPEDNPAGGVVRFIFTAAHRPGDVSELLGSLDEVLWRCGNTLSRRPAERARDL